MISNIIKLMAAPDGNMDNFQMSVMSQILLKMCVDSPNEASITLFAEMCNKHEDQRVRDIGAQLYDFTIHGKYARLFDRRLSPTIRFSSRFIVAELGQLKAQPNLQTVVLMSVIQQAQDAMFQKDDGRRRAFILDEAWEYITDGAATSNNAFFAEFIEAGWRRFRKTQAMGSVSPSRYRTTTHRAPGRRSLPTRRGCSPWRKRAGYQPSQDRQADGCPKLCVQPDGVGSNR